MTLPGFAAERSLSGSHRRYAARRGARRGDGIEPQSLVPVGGAGGFAGLGGAQPEPGLPDSTMVASQQVPGGPSTVPVGYERTCRRVPYLVCVEGGGCWREYHWVCTYRPIRRMQ